MPSHARRQIGLKVAQLEQTLSIASFGLIKMVGKHKYERRCLKVAFLWLFLCIVTLDLFHTTFKHTIVNNMKQAAFILKQNILSSYFTRYTYSSNIRAYRWPLTLCSWSRTGCSSILWKISSCYSIISFNCIVHLHSQRPANGVKFDLIIEIRPI